MVFYGCTACTHHQCQWDIWMVFGVSTHNVNVDGREAAGELRRSLTRASPQLEASVPSVAYPLVLLDDVNIIIISSSHYHHIISISSSYCHTVTSTGCLRLHCWISSCTFVYVIILFIIQYTCILICTAQFVWHETQNTTQFASYTARYKTWPTKPSEDRPSQGERRISRSCPILFDVGDWLEIDLSQMISLFCGNPSVCHLAHVLELPFHMNGAGFPFIPCPSPNANLSPLNLFPSIGIVAALLPLELWRH